MHRHSSKTNRMSLFSSVESLLTGKALKVHKDAEKWHNRFRIQVASRIDEDIFRPLFHNSFGAPNKRDSYLYYLYPLSKNRL